MTRPSRTGGKRSKAKTRSGSPAKGRNTTKTKRRIATATPVKRRSISGPSKELNEARERHSATAEILKVIASSPSDVQPVFDAIVASANRLIGGYATVVFRFIDGSGHLAAFTPISPDADEKLKAAFPQPIARVRMFRRAQVGEVLQVDDTEKSDERLRDIARARGFRSVLYVPLKSKETSIGVIATNRRNPGPFSTHDVQLLQTFADQAVIAIENVRLFDEVQAKTRDLTESLTYQTGSANILNVIASSPTDVAPVLKAIVESACVLCGAYDAILRLKVGDDLEPSAHHGPIPSRGDKWPINRNWTAGRAVIDKKPVHIHDLLSAEGDDLQEARERALEQGHRTALSVPLMRDGEGIGVIVLRRQEVHPFSDRQVALLQTFADQAVIAIENVRLFNETQKALERQTATAEILKVIASSPSDAQPVFDAIVAHAARLIDGFSAGVYRFIDGYVHLAALTSVSPTGDDALRANFPRPINDVHFETAQAGEVMEITDTEDQPNARLKEVGRARGFRSILYVPLRGDDVSIGVIAVSRPTVGAFAPHHIDLLQTFADQAVIAIENVRLFNETQEALERQTASADILKVIASSPSDVQPVFEAIAERSNRLIEGLSTAVYNIVDDTLHLMAFTRTDPEADAALLAAFPRPLSGASWGARVRNGESVQIADFDASTEAAELRHMARLRGFRSLLFVPLRRDGVTIGMISVTRTEPGTFAPNHVQLLQTFADQAVIAIGNVRLFDEVQARTRELSEALEQQTATSEVLEVISTSTGELQPVFQKMLENATRTCGARFGVMSLWDGTHFNFAAGYEVPPAFAEVRKTSPIPPVGALAKVVETRRFVQIDDVRISPGYLARAPHTVAIAELAGARTLVIVPMVKEDELIGIITIYRQEVKPFSGKQIALVKNFTKQSVIAIENARLLNELRQRTNDLTESLQQQTATSEILRVISSSPGDLAPVFDAMLAKAMELCGANFGVLNTFDGSAFSTSATYGLPPAYDDYRRSKSLDYGPGTAPARLLEGEPYVELADLLDSEAYRAGEPNRRALVDIGGARSLLAVPLLKDERVVGNVMIFRQDPLRFSDKQIALLEQFAAQAVIAIENTRLLKELRQRTDDLSESLEQQTATSEVLQVISSTPGDLEPVFKKMLENATSICGANFGQMNLYEEGLFRPVANYNVPAAYTAWLTTQPPFQPHAQSGLGTVARTHQVIHVADIRTLPAYLEGDPSVVAISDLAGARSYFVVPMLKENELIGAITIYRQEVKPFAEKQTEVVANFASQAVIAIENARLLSELRERTTELSQSLDELRTAQDRLVQTEKLASLGQLTAGIAHEIKNPLNFVNNFSALSAELIDELDETLASALLDQKMRGEVNELTQMLKSNLEKVVQHGRRADSIVKNMLLHSREGSGEQRPADINALLDESLNLAYQGARAEKPGFNITLQRDFDASAGAIELFPQDITRAFLNLISNGFYAASKRRAENGDPNFEAVLTAVTKNLGNHVEIRIRDNGTGIPPEVKEKIFNPFFTTKPAGEGTGLGLSMSHDIIVKQHGGRIEVETEPGQFTEFRIVLPRAGGSLIK